MGISFITRSSAKPVALWSVRLRDATTHTASDGISFQYKKLVHARCFGVYPKAQLEANTCLYLMKLSYENTIVEDIKELVESSLVLGVVVEETTRSIASQREIDVHADTNRE